MKSLWTWWRGGRSAVGSLDPQTMAALSARLANVELKVKTQAGMGCMPATMPRGAERPSPALAELLTQLPKLAVRQSGTVDFAGSDSLLLAELASHADTSCRSVLRGMSAIGSLMAHAGPEVEDGALPADAFEALGVLLAELSELSGMLLALQTNCRRSAAPSAAAG